MAKRTEEAKIFRAPITVTLGGEQYQIAPLVIRDARKWRQDFAGLISQFPKLAATDSSDPEAFENAATQLFVAMPDRMADLFFAYAKDLDRDAIEETATESELAEAIDEVMAVAFPLVRGMTGAMARVAQ